MKHLLLCTLLVGSAALSTGCASTNHDRDEAAMIASARELDARYLAAFNAGDVDTMLATYWNSPDLVSFPPDAFACYGYSSVREHLEAGEGAPGAQLRLEDMHYRVAGDYVLGWGTWTMTIPGEAEAITGRYTDVKTEKDGEWVFVLDHVSATPAAHE